MGCCYSKLEREEAVSRCKSRKRYMKQLVQARQAWSVAHSMYLRSLRSTGSALFQFSTNETDLHIQPHHHIPPLLPSSHPHQHPQNSHPPHPQNSHPHPPPPIPMSPSSDTWTSSITGSSPALPPPPPPPPPPSSTWDFWDPFGASASRVVTEEEWEEATTSVSDAVVTVVNGAASTVQPPSTVSGFSKESSNCELAMVVSRNSKDLVEIIKELDEYLLKAADAGSPLSALLETPSLSPVFSCQHKEGKIYNYGWNLSSSLWTWGSSPKMNGFGKTSNELVRSNITGGDGGVINRSHSSTIEKLYAWEKKLYQEVKAAETMKIEHEKKMASLKKLDMKSSDYIKTEKTKKEVEKLESQMMVALQAIETTSAEIIKLRETQLYPELLEIVKGLMCMWRSMYECHQVQKHIVQQLKYLNTVPSTEPTSEIHRQSTLQLELEAQQWHLSFCNLVKAQRDYIQSLTGWLRLCLFQFNKNMLSRPVQESKIYSLCDEWHLVIDRIPDKVASEGIKSFLTVMHAIVAQQAEEHKQKKRSESVFKDLEKKVMVLRSLECKYDAFSMREGSARRNPVGEKRAKVEILKAKAEEQKMKHEKSVSVTRAMTVNNLQMGLPHVFEAMVGFSTVCMHAFESVYNSTKAADQVVDVKRLLP